jgi:hypothetical protein
VIAFSRPKNKQSIFLMKFVNSYQTKELRCFKYNLALAFKFSSLQARRIRDFTLPKVYQILKEERQLN